VNGVPIVVMGNNAWELFSLDCFFKLVIFNVYANIFSYSFPTKKLHSDFECFYVLSVVVNYGGSKNVKNISSVSVYLVYKLQHYAGFVNQEHG